MNLENQTISFDGTDGMQKRTFDINNYKKTCLLNGYDDIDYLLSMKEEITAFRKTNP